MLRIHILNVGHGDSIVLEYCGEGDHKSFAVIDSNCKPDSSPPALDLLRTLGANSLSFVAITHPHADHYMGMRAILESFSKKIETLYTFPIKKESEHLKKLLLAYKKNALATTSDRIQKTNLELAHILALASKSAAKSWEAPSGIKSLISAPGFPNQSIWAILPPSRVKGRFFQGIIEGSIEPENEELNDLSLAFLIEYGGHQVILAGDGSKTNWGYQNKQWKNAGIKFSPSVVKLPHHGSKYDCDATVQNIIFGDLKDQQPNAIACISADGKTHPSLDVLDGLTRRSIKPYCTNLSTRCGNTRNAILKSEGTDPALLRLIGSAVIDGDETVRPCQGNIVLELLPGQPIKITTQHNNLCALRGDYEFLSSNIH